MSKTPLQIDKETVEKFNITPELELTPIQKLVFLQEQLAEIKRIQWRSRVDIAHANRLSESDNPVLRDKGFQNRGQHTNEVEQFTGALRMLNAMIDELREEYPELKLPVEE